MVDFVDDGCDFLGVRSFRPHGLHVFRLICGLDTARMRPTAERVNGIATVHDNSGNVGVVHAAGSRHSHAKH